MYETLIPTPTINPEHHDRSAKMTSCGEELISVRRGLSIIGCWGEHSDSEKGGATC